MSGSGNCQWSVQSRPAEVTADLAEDVECPSSPTDELLKCLKEKTAKELIEAQTKRQVGYIYITF